LKPVETRDRDALERFLRRDEGAQVYGLADLDEPFWSAARAFVALDARGEIEAACLLLPQLHPPIVYAMSEPGHEPTRALVAALAPDLPDAFFANLPSGLAGSLGARYEIEPHGEHVKMLWSDRACIAGVDTSHVEALGPAHEAELAAFYGHEAYLPEERGGRFFAPYMLALGPWFGVREAGRLVCAAGLHVLSRRYGVAAIGNVATRPDRRSRGLARAATARLCSELAPMRTIALNVASANTAARRCYESLGFRDVLRYEEAGFRRRTAR
jgi:ribosomal protein S18 acetylase RimI-like enzyme